MQFLKEIKEIETNYEELLTTVETTNLKIQLKIMKLERNISYPYTLVSRLDIFRSTMLAQSTKVAD